MTAIVDINAYSVQKAKQSYQIIGDEPIPVASFERSGDVILKKVLQEIGRYEDKKLIFHGWPNLETACTKFCELISGKFPGKSKPLVNEVIANAFDAFDQSAAEREPELTQMIRFLQVLATAADQIQRIDSFTFVNNASTPKVWKHFSEPLVVWARKQEAREICFTKGPELSVDAIVGGRNVLCTQIMSITDMGKLAMFANGATIGKMA